MLALPGHKSFYQTIAFSADGFRLAAPGPEHSVLLWDVSPLTPELLDEREARSVAGFWLAKTAQLGEAAERIRADRTVSDVVRQKALALAQQGF